MIAVFGSLNIDLVARVPKIARPGETVLAPAHTTVCGGKGANQAIAAARLCRGTMNGVEMIGCVGDDDFGRRALANLRAEGVMVDLVRIGRLSTGCAFISVDAAGENAITVASGANAEVCVDAAVAERIAAASVLVLQMETPLEAGLVAAQVARRAGTKVIWNVAPAPADFELRGCESLLHATDVLVVNEHEARALLAAFACSPPTLKAAAIRLADHVPVCVVTAGSRGAFVAAPGGRSFQVEAPMIEPVDTTGAGDTFVGILAVGVAEALPFEESAFRACRGAALACLSFGAQAGMTDRVRLHDGLALG